MTTIAVEFDGTNFVPEHPVHLPVGTKATVAIGEAAPCAAEKSNIAGDADWQAILSQIRAAPPDPPTPDEAMRQIRMRP
jgi:hypothetical protein